MGAMSSTSTKHLFFIHKIIFMQTYIYVQKNLG